MEDRIAALHRAGYVRDPLRKGYMHPNGHFVDDATVFAGQDYSDQAKEHLKHMESAYEKAARRALELEEVRDAVPQPSERFNENELREGAALELRRVKTPQMGEEFDMAKMTVDAVLVLNRMVIAMEELQEKLDAVLALQGTPPEEPPIKLATLTDSYKDVKSD